MKTDFWLIIMVFLMCLMFIGIIGTAIFHQEDGEIFRIFLGIFTLSFTPLLIIGIWFITIHDEDSLYNVYFKSPITSSINGENQ